MFAHASTPELINDIAVLDVAEMDVLVAEAARQLCARPKGGLKGGSHCMAVEKFRRSRWQSLHAGRWQHRRYRLPSRNRNSKTTSGGYCELDSRTRVCDKVELITRRDGRGGAMSADLRRRRDRSRVVAIVLDHQPPPSRPPSTEMSDNEHPTLPPYPQGREYTRSRCNDVRDRQVLPS